MKITNNSAAPQGVHAVSGVVYLKPGQSRDVELTDVGVAQAKRLPFLGIEGAARDLSSAPSSLPPTNGTGQTKAPAPPKPVVPSEIAGLRNDYKAAFGKGPSPKWDADTLRAKIAEKAQGEPKPFDDMSDTELKTFLGTKGVSTTDETRDQLIELAKAA